jgi:hypothetical protein
MIDLLHVQVSKSSLVVLLVCLYGTWQHCVDSFDAVLLDCTSIHRHHIASRFGLSSIPLLYMIRVSTRSPKCWHGSSTLFCLSLFKIRMQPVDAEELPVA